MKKIICVAFFFLFWSSCPVCAGSVTDLKTDSLSSNSWSLSWSIPSVSTPTIVLSTDDFVTTISSGTGILEQNSTSYADLDPGTTYYFEVKNSTEADSGYVGISTPTHPEPLDGLSGNVLGLSSITWSWDSSGGAATSYKVYSASSGLVLANTAALNFTLTGISTNTAQGIKVQPYTASSATALSNAVTYYTYAAVPSDLVVNAVYESSATISWSTNTNPSGTHYLVKKATSVPGVADVVVPYLANLTANTTTIYLSPGTTHFLGVASQNMDEKPANPALVWTATVTVPSPLIGLSTESVSPTSIDWLWNSSGGGATKYDIYSSSSGHLLYTTAELGFTESELTPNTIYGIRIRPFTSSWAQSLSESVTVYTLAAVPKDIIFDPGSTAIISFSWDRNGNPTNTLYQVQYSTDGFFFHIYTPIPFSAGFTDNATAFYNLSPGTTYSFEIKAQNGDSPPETTIDCTASTVTHPALLTGLNTKSESLNTTSINWSWNSSGGEATGYDVFSSTGWPLYTTSGTEYVQSGLSTNTAYGVKVQPFTSSWSQPLSDAVTVYTLAALPLKAGESFPGVYVTSITVQWESNGNPLDTPYEVSYSTDNFSTHFSTSIPFSGFTDTTTVLETLAINTTYYVRLRAQNHHSTITAFTNLDPVCTLANAPGTVTINSVSSRTISFEWGKNDNPGNTLYEISCSSDDFQTYFSTPVAFSDNLTDNNTTIYNLSRGTTYYIRVRAQNHGAVTTDFVFGSTQTIPAQVDGLSSATVGISSITWSWNPVDGAGSYNIFQASNPAILFTSTPSASFFYAGLSTNTAYGIAVAAVTPSGQGALSGSCTVYTLAVPPADTWANVVSSTIIKVFWNNNTNPPWTEYEVSYSSLPFGSGCMISTEPLKTGTTQTLSSLQVLTTYYIRVRAFNGDGYETSFDNVASTRTYPAPAMRPYTFSLLLPADGVYQSPLDIKLVWEHSESPLPGHGITYTIRYSTCSDFSYPETVITGDENYTVPSSTLALMGYTTYYWKVSVIDSTDSYIWRDCSSSFRFIVSTSQVSSPDGLAYVDVYSGLPAQGFVTIEETSASVEPILSNANRLAARERRFHIIQDKAHLIVVKNNLGNPVSVPNLNARLSFGYSSSNGYYQGTSVKTEHIQIARLDENSGQWEILPDGATLDRSNNKVTGYVDRFSYFTLLGCVIPLSVLSGARNFPNPFRAGREVTTIQYTLTEDAQVTLKIYTPFGDLVLKKEFAPGVEGGRGQPTGYTNKIPWDGRNGAGKIVANGIYVCRIVAKTSGGRKKITRLIGVKK